MSKSKTNVGRTVSTYTENINGRERHCRVERYYRSNLLKLELQTVYKEQGFGLFMDSMGTIDIPDLNPDKVIIRLDGVDKNLSRRELTTYLNDSLKHRVSSIRKEAEKFMGRFPRLLDDSVSPDM